MFSDIRVSISDVNNNSRKIHLNTLTTWVMKIENEMNDDAEDGDVTRIARKFIGDSEISVYHLYAHLNRSLETIRNQLKSMNI